MLVSVRAPFPALSKPVSFEVAYIVKFFNNGRSAIIQACSALCPGMLQRLSRAARGFWGKEKAAAFWYGCPEMLVLMAKDYLSLAIIMSATFLPLISMPPKMGPMRGVPETAEEAIPQT